MATVAECLNQEGFRPPKRAPRFTSGLVGGFLAKGGRSGPRPVALSATGLLHKGGWLLTDLARHLSMPSATLHRWRQVAGCMPASCLYREGTGRCGPMLPN